MQIAKLAVWCVCVCSRLNCFFNSRVDVAVDGGSNHLEVVQSNAVKLIVANMWK